MYGYSFISIVIGKILFVLSEKKCSLGLPLQVKFPDDCNGSMNGKEIEGVLYIICDLISWSGYLVNSVLFLSSIQLLKHDFPCK